MYSKTTNSLSQLSKRNLNIDPSFNELPAKKIHRNPISKSLNDKENYCSGQFISLHPKPESKQTKIIKLWLEIESKHCPPNSFKPLNVTCYARAKLIHWLMKVTKTFQHDREIFYLSVDILDRYLALSYTKMSELQLVGITCLFLAAKFESDDFCCVSDYSGMTADAFTSKDVIAMEIKILFALDWALQVPTPFLWLKLFLQSYFSDDIDIPNYSQYKLIQSSKVFKK
ncbi:G1/S-specific cyclin-E2-like [Octopus sinensis]|uniref:G1/S-specific cyclin-E2-like n=1 Tax=Octopus sinensis TaxID=2607531 RepID=A0A6P7U9G1_9MOLL|nr:G1/S-specific cyclin-E2-like [Octopus sinensis]